MSASSLSLPDAYMGMSHASNELFGVSAEYVCVPFRCDYLPLWPVFKLKLFSDLGGNSIFCLLYLIPLISCSNLPHSSHLQLPSSFTAPHSKITKAHTFAYIICVKYTYIIHVYDHFLRYIRIYAIFIIGPEFHILPLSWTFRWSLYLICRHKRAFTHTRA